MKSYLVIIGAAPCVKDDIANLPVSPEACDFIAVGLDAMDKLLGRIEYMATYHPYEIAQCRERRTKAGGNVDYKVVSHITQGASGSVDIVIPFKQPSGSSALLGVLAGIKEGYRKMILCGCPLEDEVRDGRTKNYQQFRDGWKAHLDEYVGKVRSMSGWTKDFLGYPTEEWLAR